MDDPAMGTEEFNRPNESRRCWKHERLRFLHVDLMWLVADAGLMRLIRLIAADGG